MHPSTRVGVGYNIQIAVDAKHKLIAEQQVHNKVSDLGLLAETADAARENLCVEQIEVVAARGYFKIEDIECKTNKMELTLRPISDRKMSKVEVYFLFKLSSRQGPEGKEKLQTIVDHVFAVADEESE